jgi:type I restriction enzyme S subunit
MISAEGKVLADAIQFSKDGEWGKNEPFEGSVEMFVIRGTDFDAVRRGDWSTVPRRHIARRQAEAKALQPGDILIETAGGSSDRPTGRTLYISRKALTDHVPATCASFARLIRLGGSDIDSAFIYWWLQALYASGYLQAFHTQHTGVARFQWTTCSRTLSLPRLPLVTQRKIAAVLSAYEDVIENNTRRIRVVEEMARRIYRQWFVDFRYPGHEGVLLVDSELGPIPEGWHVRLLGELVDINARTMRRTAELAQIEYVDISSVASGTIREYKHMTMTEAPGRARRLVSDGDVLWSTVRPNLRAYALMLSPAPNCVASTGFAVLSSRRVPFVYTYLLTTSDRFVDYLASQATGSAYPAVTGSTFAAARILTPPAAILASFNELTEPLLRLVDPLKKGADRSSTIRDLLLPRLLSGEINVDDLDIAVEDPAA